jgi:hypothetical protein
MGDKQKVNYIYFSTIKLKTTCSSESSLDFQWTTRRDRNITNHCCENLISKIHIISQTLKLVLFINQQHQGYGEWKLNHTSCPTCSLLLFWLSKLILFPIIASDYENKYKFGGTWAPRFAKTTEVIINGPILLKWNATHKLTQSQHSIRWVPLTISVPATKLLHISRSWFISHRT